MKLFLGLAILASTILTGSTHAQSTTLLTVSPSISTVNAHAGSTKTIPVNLSNQTNRPITLSVRVQDFTTAHEQFIGPPLTVNNSSAYSLANWFANANLDKQLTVPAGQSVDYIATFRVPTSAQPKTYFGTLQFEDQRKNSYGTVVFITVGEPTTNVTIESAVFSDSIDASRPYGEFTIDITNPSDALIQPTIKARITNLTGRVVSDTEHPGIGVLPPNSSRRITIAPPHELPKDTLTATITATDQNGVTSDKSLQIENKQARTKVPIEGEVDPRDYNQIYTSGVSAVLLGTGLLFFLHRKFQKTKKHH